MDSTRWSRRSTRKALRRGLSRFEARLCSACPGIGFTARITATVVGEPPYPGTDDGIVSAIRAVLREAAADVARTCDPVDLASARDVCARHLGRPRFLATEPPVEYHATVVLDLLPGDRAAVDTLLAAQRGQAVADILRRQKTEAVALELADPAAVLVRWIEQGNADWSGLPSASVARDISAVFADHRPGRERSVEHEAVEVLREFLGSFPATAQKRMLYTLMAAGMDSAQRPQHAAKVQALLDGRTAPGAAGER